MEVQREWKVGNSCQAEGPAFPNVTEPNLHYVCDEVQPSQPSVAYPEKESHTSGDHRGDNKHVLLKSQVGESKEKPRSLKEIKVFSASHSAGDRIYCRICQEDDTFEKLHSPCMCSGSVGFVHISCLEKWLRIKGRTQCELCYYTFPLEKIQPSLWQYLKKPTHNMDVSGLVSDASCFVMLTPLLSISTYFCMTGAKRYRENGEKEAAFAVIMLMISLITIYGAWLTLAVMYHRSVWLSWRAKRVRIRVAAWKSEEVQPRKKYGQAESDEDTVASGSCGNRSRQDSVSVLIKPAQARKSSKEAVNVGLV